MSETPGITLLAVGLLYASTCAPYTATIEDVRRWLNRECPTGLAGGWVPSGKTFSGGEPNPCPCEEHPDTHIHRLWNC